MEQSAAWFVSSCWIRVSNCCAFATAFEMRCRILSILASVRSLRRDIRVTARAAVTIAACIGVFRVDFADLDFTVDVFDIRSLYPIRPFPSSPFGDIFSNIFYGVGRDSRSRSRWEGSAGWGSRAGGERAPVGTLAPVGTGRRTGERGRGRQESVTQQCPAGSGSHPRQTLAWVPYRLCLLFNVPTHTPHPLQLGPLLGSPHQQKFFNINKV